LPTKRNFLFLAGNSALLMEIEIVASYKTVCTLKAFAVSKSHLAWNDYESTIITLCDIKDGDKVTSIVH